MSMSKAEKKKTPWNGLLEAKCYQLIIFHFVTNLSAWFDSQLNMHNLYNKINKIYKKIAHGLF